MVIPSLKLTAKAPENSMELQLMKFLLGPGLYSGTICRECICLARGNCSFLFGWLRNDA